MIPSANKTKKVIPSQRIIGSNKELFIIKYEGSVIEIHRTNNLYEPLTVQLNGAVIDTIPSKQNKEIIFTTEDGGTHILEVWNERIDNSPLIKVIGKDGIAIVIDGIPVQNSLADPLTGLSRPKFFLWLLTAFLFFVSIVVPIIRIQEGYKLEYSIFTIAYIVLFVMAIIAALTFQRNPIRSIWLAITVSLIELIYSLYFILSLGNFSLYTIIFTVLRLSILYSLFYSLKNIKSILDTQDEEKVKVPKIKKIKRRKILTLRNNLIFVFSIILIVGLYFGIPKIVEIINEPSIERDSSIEFRSDLNLPELIPYRKGDKWGYCDRNKNIVIPAVYNYVKEAIDDDLLIVNMNGLYGVIDNKGNKIIPFIYTSIINGSTNKTFIAKRENYKNGVIDDHNNVVIPLEYSSLIPWGKYYIAEKKIYDNTFKGLLSSNGKVVINFIYTELSPFSDNKELLIASIKKTIYRDYGNYCQNVPFKYDFCGIINSSGKIILPIEYFIDKWEILTYNKTNLIKIRKWDEYNLDYSKYASVFDEQGIFVIPFQYDDITIWDCTRKYIVAELDNKMGIINYKNDAVIPIMYEYNNIGQINDSIYFGAGLDGKAGLINEAGEVVVPFEYSGVVILNSEDKWISVSKGLNHGMIDLSNKIKIPIEYSDWIYYSDGMAAVRKSDESEINKLLQSSNVYDSSYIGNLLSELYQSESFIKRRRILEFNVLKEQLITPELRKEFYRSNKEFFTYRPYEEFAMGVVSGYDWESKFSSKWGYIDNNGKLKIDFIYDEAKNFQNGFAKVKYKEKWGMINKNNQVVIPIKYDDINLIKNYDLIEVRLDHKWGYVDLNGIEYFTND
jgi:Ca2+/Na+ antiporter